MLVAYRVYRGPNNQYGKIPGVLGRSEFGLEIVVAIAFQVYVVGLSFDKVCLLLHFFQNLKLSKSQADSLLHQLARHWHKEFDVLCTLLANSLVVHADETSWSINSVWAFLSEKARLLLFGVHKDAATLAAMLDPATFAGIVISDDAAVYANFSQAQKCWAHLLRKAIKLTLQEPDNDGVSPLHGSTCWRFTARRVGCSAMDDSVTPAGHEKWPPWKTRFSSCAARCGLRELPPLEGLDNDYRLLVNEVMRLLLAEELFTFVTAKPVEQPNGETQTVGGTNNEAERTLRNPAAGAQDGPDQQDDARRPAANDRDQCAGIAAAVPDDVHACRT